MKLEVGMYVRTNKGLIAKYTGYEKDEENIEYNKYKFNGKIYWYYEYYNDYVYEENFQEWFEEKVIKVSHNIIDLIEAGDYVNGIYIEGNKGYYLETLEHDYENSSLGHIEYLKIYPREIETVVTKEQFESMSYKVGE